MLLVMLLAVACQKSDLSGIFEGKEVQATLTLAVPASISTKADAAESVAETEEVSAGAEVDVVYYEIWNADHSVKYYPKAGEDPKYVSVNEDGEAEVPVTLVANQTYTFVFWAQNKDCGAYDITDLSAVGIKYDVIAAKGNDDVFDAFYAVKSIEIKRSKDYDTIILRRPFAQLNFGATLMETDLGEINITATEVKVSQLSKVFMTFEGAGDPDSVVSDVTFVANGLVSATEGVNASVLSTNGQEYTWITMDYMLMTEMSSTVTVNAMFTVDGIGELNHEIPGVSIKKNYRTNIVGDLFTTGATLKVVIDPNFVLNEDGEFDDIIHDFE